MMKDMTVKELIVKCGVGWNDFKAELLRRFEDSKCCGNCKSHKQGHITGCSYKNGMSSNEYCLSWQTDGLTRAEREGV
jgi:hypothetical protein